MRSQQITINEPDRERYASVRQPSYSDVTDEEALAQHCPRCGAILGASCVMVTVDEGTPCNPHRSRLIAAYQARQG